MKILKLIVTGLMVLNAAIVYGVPVGSSSATTALDVQSDDKVVVVGYATDGATSDTKFLVARYTTDGDLDTTFGTDGVTLTTSGPGKQAQAVVIQSTDNKIVSTGNSSVDSLVVRYNTDGTFDTSFGTDGIVTLALGDTIATTSVAFVDTGTNKIVVAGGVVISGAFRVVLAQLNLDGTLDTGFGTGGFVTTAIGDSSVAHALAVQTDGKLVVAGTTTTSGVNQFFVARYNADGTLDTGFGTTGITITAIGTNDQAFTLAIQPSDGKILVGGFSDGKFVIARYTTAGVLDTGYGTSGATTTTIGSNAYIRDIAVQADGKAVVAGVSDSFFTLARYTTAGALDTSTFGTSGIVITPIGAADIANTVGIQSDDKIVAAGTSDNSSVIVRYSAAGVLDATYGFNGITIAPAGTNVSPGTICHIWEEQAQNTNGGTFTAGAWQTRTLNRIVGNLGNVSLTANQFELQPGIYQIVMNRLPHQH